MLLTCSLSKDTLPPPAFSKSLKSNSPVSCTVPKERYGDLLSFLSLAVGAAEAEGDPGTVSVLICDSHWQYTGGLPQGQVFLCILAVPVKDSASFSALPKSITRLWKGPSASSKEQRLKCVAMPTSILLGVANGCAKYDWWEKGSHLDFGR